MALVRRRRFITTNIVNRVHGCTADVSYRWITATVIQDVLGAVCWRCKREHRTGDHLVHIAFNSEDTLKPTEIYHYRCIPSARWNAGKLAGSLPAWELPCDESPAENVGTSSAAVPTS